MTLERFASCTPDLRIYRTISEMRQVGQEEPERASTYRTTTLSVRTTECLSTVSRRRSQCQSITQEKFVFPGSLSWSMFELIDRSRPMQSWNPFSGRITTSDARQVDGKAGSSSSSRPSEAPLRQTTKRRKLGHPPTVHVAVL